MTRRILIRSVTAAALVLGACGDDGALGAACILPPCALPSAVMVSVTSSATGAAVPSAVVTSTKPYSGTFPCTIGPGATCPVMGSTAGTYELDIAAPGYQTAHRSVVVTGSNPPCGCPRVDTQQVAVALVPNA
jgi:hypothetical protein